MGFEKGGSDISRGNGQPKIQCDANLRKDTFKVD